LIADYIAEGSPQQAAQFIERLFASVERLERFPQSGHYVYDVPQIPLRQVLCGVYRVLYAYSAADDVCRIITVVHGSRNILELLAERDFNESE